MKYKIEITEKLRKTIDIEADDRNEAMKTAMRLYKNQDVVLYADDYASTNFKFVEEE